MANDKLERAVAEVAEGDHRNGTYETEVQIPPPTTLRATDLRYWKKVADGLNEAQAQSVQADRLEAQAMQLRQNATALQGAFESYVAHLGEVYGFDPRTEGVDPEGNIKRTDQPV